MFGTKCNSQVYAKCNVWSADGTFKIAPIIFKQLFTLHGFLERDKCRRQVPLVYMLLPNKRNSTYKKAIEILKSLHRNLNPKEIIIDFEQAFISTVVTHFPQIRMKGCHFHFGQCLYRHFQECQLQTWYANDVEFATAIKNFIALAFVPVEDVIYAYESLILTEYYVDSEELLEDF